MVKRIYPITTKDLSDLRATTIDNIDGEIWLNRRGYFFTVDEEKAYELKKRLAEQPIPEEAELIQVPEREKERLREIIMPIGEYLGEWLAKVVGIEVKLPLRVYWMVVGPPLLAYRPAPPEPPIEKPKFKMTAAPGTELSWFGGGAKPNETVQFDFGTNINIAQCIADADGKWHLVWTIPTTETSGLKECCLHSTDGKLRTEFDIDYYTS
jgi:hypothetical protein